MGKGLGRIPGDLVHVATALVVVFGLISIPFKTKITVEAGPFEPAMRHGFPYALTLEEFRTDTYPSGEPLDYTSVLTASQMDGSRQQLTTSVNRPARLGGWLVYQMSYNVYGPDETTSVLECVRDPLYPAIAVALWVLMVAGFLTALKYMKGEGGKGWALSGVLLVGFIYLTMAKVGIGSKDLRPVLRSGWFIPHIVAYMVAYAALSALTVVGIISAIRHKPTPMTDRLAAIGWGFLTVGMTMGALWAKQSWGDWWTWDPKETTALMTWLFYGLYVHLKPRGTKALVLLIVSFLMLQMCWWGVNFLPGSLHSY